MRFKPYRVSSNNLETVAFTWDGTEDTVAYLCAMFKREDFGFVPENPKLLAVRSASGEYMGAQVGDCIVNINNEWVIMPPHIFEILFTKIEKSASRSHSFLKRFFQ